MKMRADQIQQVGIQQISARCPQCGKVTILDGITADIRISDKIICGQRRCPDPNCQGHLFVIMENGQLVKAYPPVQIDFDSTNIPERVLKPFEEALECHAAGYYTASAIMLRRALEEICEERGAQGKDLKARIKALSTKVILPNELLDGMDELRLFGNDAAHVNAASYNTISDNELRVAIEFAKEILKALYQYSALLEKLRALKSQGSA